MIFPRFAMAVFITLFLISVCLPASAHTAAQMGVAQDQYDKGIPVYWPLHAGLMSTGLILLFSGFLVKRYQKSPHRFKNHLILQSAGGTLAIAGLATSVTMVSISGAPHLRYTHDILGMIAFIGIIGTLIIGYVMYRHSNPGIRTSHRWLGRTSIALGALNIVLGISMMSMVLAQ